MRVDRRLAILAWKRRRDARWTASRPGRACALPTRAVALAAFLFATAMPASGRTQIVPQSSPTSTADPSQSQSGLSPAWNQRLRLIPAALLIPEGCEAFQADDYEGRDCVGTVLGGAKMQGRPVGPLLVRGALWLGSYHHSDLPWIHEAPDLSDPQPVRSWQFAADFGMGVAVPLGAAAAIRASAGVVLTTGELWVADHQRLLEVLPENFHFDPIGSTSLGLDVDVALEIAVGGLLRLGPAVYFQVSNEIGYVWSSVNPLEETSKERSYLISGDTELSVAPAFVGVLPLASPAGLRLEIGPEVRAQVRSAENESDLLAEGITPTPSEPEVGLRLLIGVELRPNPPGL